jgi:hypothetical protein
MSAKPELKLTDDLIREALHQEFLSVDAPPTDRVWRRVESGLARPRSSLHKPFYSWNRLAAVAAAFLIIVAGGIGLSRITQFSAPAVDLSEMPVGSGEEIAMLEADEEVSAEREVSVAAKEDAAVPAEADQVESAADQDVAAADQDVAKADDARVAMAETPPDTEEDNGNGLTEWLPVIADGFMLSRTVILGTPGGPQYPGAIYRRNDLELLLVKSAEQDEDLPTFIAYVEEYIGFDLQEVGGLNGFIHLTMAEKPGLAWQKSNLNQALLVISGSITEEELKEIAIMVE